MSDSITVAMMSLLGVQEAEDWISNPLKLPPGLQYVLKGHCISLKIVKNVDFSLLGLHSALIFILWHKVDWCYLIWKESVFYKLPRFSQWFALTGFLMFVHQKRKTNDKNVRRGDKFASSCLRVREEILWAEGRWSNPQGVRMNLQNYAYWSTGNWEFHSQMLLGFTAASEIVMSVACWQQQSYQQQQRPPSVLANHHEKRQTTFPPVK